LQITSTDPKTVVDQVKAFSEKKEARVGGGLMGVTLGALAISRARF